MTDTKINFRCVPQSGFAKGKGFRAEFLKDKTDVVDLDNLVKEAMDNGYFNWMNPTLVRESIKGFLQTMIDNTVKDGRTRKNRTAPSARPSAIGMAQTIIVPARSTPSSSWRAEGFALYVAYS